jgi:hypothetical protein
LSIEKITYYLSIVTATTGIFLLIPFSSFFNESIFILHIFLGLILGIVLIRLIYRHVPVELSNPFKPVVKKWNGFKVTIYIIAAIITGIIIYFFYIKWVMYFHGFIGLWALLVGWKHKK